MAIHSLPLSDNFLRLHANPSGNTRNLLQVSLASVSLATSVLLTLLRQPSLLATFTLLAAHALLAIEYTPALLAAVVLPLTLVGLFAGCRSLPCNNFCSRTARSGDLYHLLAHEPRLSLVPRRTENDTML